MTDKKAFIDSNILIYLIDKDQVKKEKIENFLRPDFLISTQVIAENVNVCLKKLKLGKDISFHHGQSLLAQFKVVTIEIGTIQLSFEISTKYILGFWDSLIIATALEQGCDILYSEDLQHGLIIQNQLTIVNPFI